MDEIKFATDGSAEKTFTFISILTRPGSDGATARRRGSSTT
jgi:hypothetical protein